MASELHFSRKISSEKKELFSANSRLFSTTELRLSIIFCECSAKIYALSEHEFLIRESQHPIILYTDHKPVYNFQFFLMKFPNLHLVWTEGKIFHFRIIESLTNENNPKRTLS